MRVGDLVALRPTLGPVTLWLDFVENRTRDMHPYHIAIFMGMPLESKPAAARVFVSGIGEGYVNINDLVVIS